MTAPWIPTKTSTTHRNSSFLLSILCLSLLLSGAAFPQTTYVVDNWDDGDDINPSDGICSAGTAGCTLRAAVQQAGSPSNPLTGPFIVEVPANPAGTVPPQHPLVYDLLSGPIYISGPMTIRGTDSSPTVIEAASGTGSPAILNDDGFGGTSPDEVVIENIEFRALGSVAGFFSSGSNVTLRDTIFKPADGGQGAGLDVSIWAGATTTCERCQFLDGGSPGLVTSEATSGGKVLIIDSFFRNIHVIENSEGGALRLTGGQVLLLRSEVSGNSVDTTNSTRGFTGFGLGGGIYSNGAQLTLINTTISGNFAAERGGGVYASKGAIHLSNVTVVENHAEEYAGGGGIYAGNLAVIQTRNSLIGLNTSQPCTGSPLCFVEGWDCAGIVELESLGYNVFHRTNGCTITDLGGGTDFFGALPKILPLANLGGHTQVRALESDSVGVDDGNPTGCYANEDLDSGTAEVALVEDQRGSLRPQDGDMNGDARCDIGAYEYDCAGRGASCQAGSSLFEDGFESGNTNAWG